MRELDHRILGLSLAGLLLALPGAALAQDEHAGHHPDAAQPAAQPPADAAPAQAAAGEAHRGMAGGGMMSGGMDMCAMMGGMRMSAGLDDRIANLRARIGITPAQEQRWEALAAALRAAAARMDGMHREMAGACRGGAQGSALERLDRHDRMLTEAHATIQQVRPALAALYASLSSAQRATADGALDLPHVLMPPMQMGGMMGQHP